MAFGTTIGGMTGGGGVIGGASVRLVLDAAQFHAGLVQAQTTLQRVGAGMSRVGSVMTRGLTVPIVAAGAAATKLAYDYETAFTKIDAVSNASQKQIAKWKTEVLDMAGKTARAPQELADALYFLASAGLKSSEIMPTLEMSAKAAAAGLVETADIARLVAQTLNAYADSGMTAAQATDVLVAAVKEGTAEPTEFADAMGRILPIASKAKIGFDQIAGSLAGLSNVGLDVNEGVTAMRGLLQALITPGTQAKDALQGIGLTAQDLLDSFQEDGLLGAIRLVEERSNAFGKSQADVLGIMRQVVPNVRALTGLFGLTAQDAAKMDASFRRVTHSTGEMNKAFRDTKRGPQFEFQQALAELQKVAIEVGREILPVVTDIVRAVGDMARAFGNLSPAMQDNIIKWGLILAAAGPVLGVFGRIVSATARVGAALRGLGAAAPAANALGASLGAFVPVAAAGVVSVVRFRQEFEKVSQVGKSAGDMLVRFGVNSQTSQGAIEAIRTQVGGLSFDLAGMAGRLHGANEAFQQITQRAQQEVGALGTVMRSLGIQLTAQEQSWVNTRAAAGDFGSVIGMLRRKVVDFHDEWAEGGPQIAKAITQLDNLGVVMSAQRRTMLLAAITAGDKTRALEILGNVIRKLPKHIRSKIDIDTSKAEKDVKRTGDSLSETLMSAERNALATTKEIAKLARSRAEPKIDVNDSAAKSAIANIKAQLKTIPDETVYVNIVPRGKIHSGGYIPRMHSGGLAPDEVPAILQAGEFVVRRDAVKKLGLPLLQTLNRMHSGGVAGHHGGGGNLVREFERLQRQLQQMSKDAERRTQVEQQLDKVRERLSKEWQRRVDAETQAFERLQERADALRQTIDEFQTSVRDAIKNFASVQRFEFDPEKGDAGQQLLSQLSGQLDEAQRFSNLLQHLTAQGLDPELVKQLGEAGPAALDILRAIQMAGVQNVNKLQQQINTVATALGQRLTDPLFGKQAREMDAAIAATVKAFAAFRKDFNAIPGEVQKEFRRSVGSLVNGFDALSKMLGRIPGLPKPKAAATGFEGWVTSPTLFLAGERGAEHLSITPAGQIGSGGGTQRTIIRERVINRGDTINVTVPINNAIGSQNIERLVMSAVQRAISPRSSR